MERHLLLPACKAPCFCMCGALCCCPFAHSPLCTAPSTAALVHGSPGLRAHTLGAGDALLLQMALLLILQHAEQQHQMIIGGRVEVVLNEGHTALGSAPILVEGAVDNSVQM